MPSKSWERLGLNPDENPYLDREENMDALFEDWERAGKNTKEEFLTAWKGELNIPGIELYMNEVYDGFVKAFWKVFLRHGSIHLLNVGTVRFIKHRTEVSEHPPLKGTSKRNPPLIKEGIYYRPPYLAFGFSAASMGKKMAASLAGNKRRASLYKKEEQEELKNFLPQMSKREIWLRRMQVLLERKVKTGETIGWILYHKNNNVVGEDYYTYEDSARARKDGYVARHAASDAL